jgi:hypothetical protein
MHGHKPYMCKGDEFLANVACQQVRDEFGKYEFPYFDLLDQIGNGRSGHGKLQTTRGEQTSGTASKPAILACLPILKALARRT